LGLKDMESFRTLDAWMAAMPETDRARYSTLKENLTTRSGLGEVDIEYSFAPTGKHVLRIRQQGHLLQGSEAAKPLAWVSTLSIAPLVTDAPASSSFLPSGDDRRINDRRGYSYPPAFMKYLREAIEHSKESGASGT